ncbi:glycoside hydrolase family 57 protein [Halosquirtibacter xylanolyticus]|uniref:glycoside hydrolase family 57 protein n=1 Tax=Halosquirtibacter xylanolyticus TaxID=3374599 RepID=UPI0037478632|nr:glycoside hydrolase family 57 protein [Prolixibacteraceae bacterium]
MKNISLYFQIHHPFHLRKYRFLDIGNDHYYFDDYHNENEIQNVASTVYLPNNERLLSLIEKYKGAFKVAFSISGTTLELFQRYAPIVIDSFKQLANTGCVEFLSGTYAYSLSSIVDEGEFKRQVQQHEALIEELFGQKPRVFCNTDLVYSDEIGEQIASMGFDGVITEGAKHILGWKSPNFVYCNAINPRLKVLMRNYKLSDDLRFKFSNKEWSEYPLTAEKYLSWIEDGDENEEIYNLCFDYDSIGKHNAKESGIYDFINRFVELVVENQSTSFVTPTEILKQLQTVSAVHVPYPISWTDEERDLSSWLGNDLQKEAFNKLYAISALIKKCQDTDVLHIWNALQSSDHLSFMSTKWFSDGQVEWNDNPYESPYDAFINYMNVLNDFKIQLERDCPTKQLEDGIGQLKRMIEEKCD